MLASVHSRLLLALLGAAAPGAAPAGPHDVAWIWPAHDLPAPAPAEAAVLVQSVLLGEGTPRLLPRRRPLAAGSRCRITPVVHVHPAPGARVLSPRDEQVILDELLRAAARSTSGWVQLDFEAPAPMRAAWRRLVTEARQRLHRGVRLSVTAPASWCSGDAWLGGLPADEVVPMFFRMGTRADDWLARAVNRPESLHPSCRSGSAGFSIQERPPSSLPARYGRRYWFLERGRSPYAIPNTRSPT